MTAGARYIGVDPGEGERGEASLPYGRRDTLTQPSPSGERAFAERARRLAGISGWLLGWRPAAFWAATPDELAAVMDVARGQGAADEAVSPDQLARMMEQFPDG